MRVVTGRFKYTTLLSPKNDDIRPTTDRVKVDIFNILMPYIKEDGIFLDLFCGTGAIGIEAVSRGFNKAELVDFSKEAIDLASKNIEKTRNKQCFKIARSDARNYLLSTRNTYDIIFMDAPYNYKDTDALIKIIAERKLLNEGGVLVIEKARKEPLPDCSLPMFKEKLYSATAVYYYKNESPREDALDE